MDSTLSLEERTMPVGVAAVKIQTCTRRMLARRGTEQRMQPATGRVGSRAVGSTAGEKSATTRYRAPLVKAQSQMPAQKKPTLFPVLISLIEEYKGVDNVE